MRNLPLLCSYDLHRILGYIYIFFNLPEVIATLPEELQENDEIPSVAMKVDSPIRNKILNYRQTVSTLNIEIDEDGAFLSEQLSCECSISPFCDPHHKHIVTGDLRVIEHNKLRKLFSKGLNYREKKSTNYINASTKSNSV